MAYAQRNLEKIVKEICSEKDCPIECKGYSGDWVFKLSYEGKSALVYGYKFANNDSALSRVCDDKAALSAVLEDMGIPCVHHEYFEGVSSKMVGEEGMWTRLLNLFNKSGKLVVKPNSGTGGNNVYKCENLKEYETAVTSLLRSYRAIAISPFIEIKNEYRLIVEEGKVLLAYSKQRPHVIGDGVHTLKELIESTHFEDVDIIEDLDFKSVPKDGEKVVVSWKHNLGQGSLPSLITDKDLAKKLIKFALNVGEKLNIGFASVDIVEDNKGKFGVLEINSGIMMENFSKLSKENYEIAKHVYKSAIYDYFNVKNLDKKNFYEELSEEVKGSKNNGR